MASLAASLFGGAVGLRISRAQAVVAPADAGSSFRLEGKPAIDDVFGDASDYRRTVDRFLELTAAMQSMRDEFARAVQTALNDLGSHDTRPAKRRLCPVDRVAAPYARAHRLGAEYLRIGRELTRHYEQVKEFDRLGETIGLTPDYRWKVRRVLQQYGALLTDYREMKVAFHDQLADELRFAGCDLEALLLRADPKWHPGGSDEKWPQPGQPGAPGVLTAKAERGDHETPPPSLPADRVPPPQPIPIASVKSKTAPADHEERPRSGVLFYVDNSRCQRGTVVFVDGKRLGEVPAAARVGFQAAAGTHELCLLDDPKKSCGAPGTVRKSYLHDGWTITLRCE